MTYPPPLSRDLNRHPTIKALKRGGVRIMGLHSAFALDCSMGCVSMEPQGLIGLDIRGL